jgi:hypothetical protein
VSKQALIIGTSLALSDIKTGASIRLHTVREILNESGYDTTLSTSQGYKRMPKKRWDLIAIVSYSAVGSYKKARNETKFIWFDATDSWHFSRKSRIKSGEVLQIFLLLRDIYRLKWTIKVDLITFIALSDAKFEHKYTSKIGKSALIFPNRFTPKSVQGNQNTRFVFVADGNYGPNRKALKFLEKVTDLLPPDFEILLVGRNLISLKEKFVILGNISDNQLYRAYDIHLAPIFSGGGIKNKVAEPLFFGLRVISTSAGANGLLESPKLIIQNSLEGFARAMIQESSREPKSNQDTIFELDQSRDLIEILKNPNLKSIDI